MAELDLETLYFPHKFVKRLPIDEALPSCIEFCNKASEKARKKLKCELNIPYGTKPRETFDIIGTDLPDDSPIFIHIHGGYWLVESIHTVNQTFIAENFHKHGIKTIVIGYELCPNLTVLEIMKNIEIAVKKCIEYARTKKSRGVFLGGHSAGAQLVAALFVNFINTLPNEERNLIKAAFLSCGIYDLTPLVETSVNADLHLTKASAEEASPMFKTFFREIKTIFYLLAGEHDSPAFIEQSEKFHAKLINDGIRSHYHLFRETDHFQAMEKLVEEDSEVFTLYLDAIQNAL